MYRRLPLSIFQYRSPKINSLNLPFYYHHKQRIFFSTETTKKTKQQKITLYDDLEIKRTATQKEIKQSYNRLVKKYHPDVAGKDSEQRFRRIQAAFGI